MLANKPSFKMRHDESAVVCYSTTVKRRAFIVLCILFLVGAALPIYSRVLADSGLEYVVTPVESPTPDDSAQLQVATETYFDAVATYRDLEDKYLVAREQYYQLNTLNAQDEAIRRGKELLTARAQALKTYYAYLLIIVQRTRGMELEDKQRVVAHLEDVDRQLAAYLEGVQALDSREKVDRHFGTLNNLKMAFYHVAYSALAVVKMGEVQTAIDSSSVLATDLKALVEVSHLSTAEKAKRNRGLEEVDRLLQRAKNNLTTQRTQYLRNASNNSYNESAYQQFQGEIDFSYTQLRQAHSFLAEVAKGL